MSAADDGGGGGGGGDDDGAMDEFTAHAFDIVDFDHNVKFRLSAPSEASKKAWLENVQNAANSAKELFEKKDEVA